MFLTCTSLARGPIVSLPLCVPPLSPLGNVALGRGTGFTLFSLQEDSLKARGLVHSISWQGQLVKARISSHLTPTVPKENHRHFEGVSQLPAPGISGFCCGSTALEHCSLCSCLGELHWPLVPPSLPLALFLLPSFNLLFMLFIVLRHTQ